MKINYHIHTTFSDGTSNMMDYCEAAIQKGFDEIAFTDHLTVFPDGSTVPHSLNGSKLEGYVEEVRKVVKRYGDKLMVRLGLEVDYIPENEKVLEDILESYEFDLVIGSVHFVDDICIDAPNHRDRMEQEVLEKGFDKFYSKYLSIVGKSIETKLFDIVGHVDLVRIWGFAPSNGFFEEQRILNLVEQHKLCLETSSRGLRQPVNSIYPSPRIMKKARELAIPITIGTDAHSAKEIDYAYDILIEYIKFFGYENIGIFSKRKMFNRKL